MAASLDKFVKAMVWAAESDKVGYDQSLPDRLSVEFYSTKSTETDCSWLTIAALKYAGFDTGSASYSGDLSAALCKRGWKRVANNGRPQVGDILLNDADHVAVYVGNGMLAQASIDEKGGTRGGKAGDQTGQEVNVRSYYDYPWDCYLRYTGGGSAPAAPAGKKPRSPQYRIYRNGKWQKWREDGQSAGVAGTAIYDFDARYLGVHGWFQLTLEGGQVLERNQHNDAHAKRVTGITVYYDTDTTKTGGVYYEALYRVQTLSGAWLKWEHDDLDGGAGDDVNAICRIQLKIGAC